MNTKNGHKNVVPPSQYRRVVQTRNIQIYLKGKFSGNSITSTKVFRIEHIIFLHVLSSAST